MGFFSEFANSFREANEEAHGLRLLNDVRSTFSIAQTWDPKVKFVAMKRFADLRKELIERSVNFSREGCIKVGRELQTQAGKSFNFDLAGSCGKWMAGAWLESKERNSTSARQAFEMLDGFADYITGELAKAEEKINCADDADDSQVGVFHYSTFEEWYLDFKRAAARANKSLALNEEQRSLIDYMDHTPLKRAFNDCIDPWTLGSDFGSHYELEKFIGLSK